MNGVETDSDVSLGWFSISDDHKVPFKSPSQPSVIFKTTRWTCLRCPGINRRISISSSLVF